MSFIILNRWVGPINSVSHTYNSPGFLRNTELVFLKKKKNDIVPDEEKGPVSVGFQNRTSGLRGRDLQEVSTTHLSWSLHFTLILVQTIMYLDIYNTSVNFGLKLSLSHETFLFPVNKFSLSGPERKTTNNSLPSHKVKTYSNQFNESERFKD